MTSELVRLIFTIYGEKSTRKRAFLSPEPLGLVCNEPRDQETMGSGDENGIRASICEYHQRTEHSYATPFPGLTRGIEPGAWGRCCTHICDNYDSFGIQTQATLVEGEGSHWCAILMPTFLLSVAYLRAVSRAIKGTERAWSHHLPHAWISYAQKASMAGVWRKRRN